MTRRDKLAAWIVDDTGFPKKGSHSVGVTRQYCGQVGKQDNCRIAVSVSVATERASLPVRLRHGGKIYFHAATSILSGLARQFWARPELRPVFHRLFDGTPTGAHF
jgi:hypothetical protein